MKKITLNVPAKINLTLDIVGTDGGYHMLNSLVTSIDIFDTVTIKKRKDDGVSLRFLGLPTDIEGKNSLAIKAAKIIKKEYSTKGVDVIIKRHIPAKAGFGGSSADVAGVINGMKILFDIKDDLTYVANSLGSDTAYMLNGGLAVMSGRGEKVKKITAKRDYYILAITEKAGVSTPACYSEYDNMNVQYSPSTDSAVEYLLKGESQKFFSVLKNDLYPAATNLNGAVKENLNALSEFGSAVMTGSGSAVYGIFETAKQRNYAYEKLHHKYKRKLIKAKTLN